MAGLYTTMRPYSAKPCTTTSAQCRASLPKLGLLLSIGAVRHRAKLLAHTETRISEPDCPTLAEALSLPAAVVMYSYLAAVSHPGSVDYPARSFWKALW